MPGRVFNPGEYPYGMNGQRGVDEIAGVGNHYTAEYWEYDPRTGRRWNIDPVVKPWESPYATFRGNPILLVDPNGDDPWVPEVDDKGDVNLVAEAGDNSESLKKFFKTDDNASKFLSEKDLNANKEYKEGEKVKLNETNFSKSMKYALNNSDLFKEPSFFDDMSTNYDCRTFTGRALDGETLTTQKTDDQWDIGQFRKRMVDIDQKDAIPGQSGFVMGLDSHWAIHFGYDKKGNEYIITKNGQYVAPTIMKYDNLSYWSWGYKGYFTLKKK